MSLFTLKSDYKPDGDQPKAIEALVKGLNDGKRDQTLLGVTGSGKTFTMANVIQQHDKPTLVIAHNKTLAAQLAAEYREFFPNHAVHYFVSYYDYYQPEAYMPVTDTYIEKEAMINEDIERLRHAATQALLTRKDVIIVASVSCIYGLGTPRESEKYILHLEKGEAMTRAALTRKFISMYFERTTADLSPGTFRALGSYVEIMPAGERVIYRIDLMGGKVASIEEMDHITRVISKKHDSVFLFPAKQYVTPKEVAAAAVKDIETELKGRLKELDAEGKVLEAERIKRRTRQDIAMIKEFGFCNGIENYSRHFDRRKPGEPSYSLLSYFPHSPAGEPDFLTIIDESHVTVPQIGAMYAGDRARKLTLSEYGFRLPSAVDNRPLKFDEFEALAGQTIFISATPGPYELKKTQGEIAEQIIRPTGLIDPEVIVHPTKGQLNDLITRISERAERKQRVLVNTLTKRTAEDLTTFLAGKGLRVRYMHSDIVSLERIEIMRELRQGRFDALIGINLLREGLDLPEVSLVAILGADHEGFLRSETTLIQISGRAARNLGGQVVLYADQKTGSMERALAEMSRRRKKQLEHNKLHGIKPKSIVKAVEELEEFQSAAKREGTTLLRDTGRPLSAKDVPVLSEELETQMKEAADNLDFESAAFLRDQLFELKEMSAVKTAKKIRTKA